MFSRCTGVRNSKTCSESLASPLNSLLISSNLSRVSVSLSVNMSKDAWATGMCCGFHKGMDVICEHSIQGKLWKHIKHKCEH